MPLLFGVDGIAMWHDPKWNPAPFFHHELFHLYHGQFVPEPRDGYPPLYLSLWCEGLAVHVSNALNPAASNKELLLQDLPERVPPLLRDLATRVRSHLVSTSADDYQNFFLRSTDPEIPSRSGYFIGMLIAKRLAEGRSLRQLARLKGRELQSEIDQALLTLSGDSSR